MEFILANVNQQLVVQDIADNVFGLAKWKLITAGVPTKDAAYADFTLATVPGLNTAPPVAPSAVYKLATGEWAFLLNDTTWHATGFTTPETITGAILVDAATGLIYWGGTLFDSPIEITAIDQGVSLDMLVKAIQLGGATFPLTFIPDQDA